MMLLTRDLKNEFKEVNANYKFIAYDTLLTPIQVQQHFKLESVAKEVNALCMELAFLN